MSTAVRWREAVAGDHESEAADVTIGNLHGGSGTSRIVEIGDDGRDVCIAQGREARHRTLSGPNDALNLLARHAQRHIHQGRRRQFRAAPIRTVATLAMGLEQIGPALFR